jgi:4-hydroxythreonine-4-phosphate dehydrogenase
MAKLLILADDLTGAADAAAHCHAAGVPARVAVDGNSALAGPWYEGVQAIQSGTRDQPAAEAGQRVFSLVRAWRAAAERHAYAPGEVVWFKKIDSMVRGNVGVELRAACAALGCPVTVVTPALPHLGRVVLRGVAQGPGLAPIAVDGALDGTGGALWHAHLGVVRDRLALRFLLDEAAAQGSADAPVVIVCDAERGDDLEAVARAIAAHPAAPLLCGSGALAGALAAALELPRAPSPPAAVDWQGVNALVVMGSRSVRAREQVRAAVAAGVRLLEVDADRPVQAGEPGPAAELASGALIVTSPANDDGQDALWAGRLTDAAAPLLASGRYSRLVVGGGATAEALLARVAGEKGGAWLEVVGLAEVGMPLLRGEGWVREAGALEVVLKPGNHGDGDLFKRWLCDSAAR